MDELTNFCKQIDRIIHHKNSLSVSDARDVVRQLNEFLYTNYEGIGTTKALEDYYDYFSDFHKYWQAHHEEILDAKIVDGKCEQVAEALHFIYKLTNGKAFANVSDKYRLSKLSDEEICRIRLLTGNQDFRGSRDFDVFADKYKADPYTFDEDFIANNPKLFLQRLDLGNLSQTDKRIDYARNIANFVKSNASSPYELIKSFDGNIYDLRNALIDFPNSGYGAKKADMVLRDMVVLGIWKNVSGFDRINVASDINTVKVALRTGIVKTAIPLVSSFIDIFCYQYSYIDDMNVKAWRRVWELWMNSHPEDNIQSPCLIDFFVYAVVGKQFCNPNLYIYKGDTCGHTFVWLSPMNKTCQVCYRQGIKGRKAHKINRVMACCNSEGSLAIENTKFVEDLPDDKKIKDCPFSNICEHKNLMPPKSISIKGQTGWVKAYSRKGDGGGGLMA